MNKLEKMEKKLADMITKEKVFSKLYFAYRFESVIESSFSINIHNFLGQYSFSIFEYPDFISQRFNDTKDFNMYGSC